MISAEEPKHRERRSFPTPVIEYEYVWMKHELFFAVLALDGLVLFFCFCCLVGVFLYRKHLTFTNTGLSVIYLFIFGCVLNLVSLPLFGIDSELISALNIRHACMARIWLLNVGFTLSVGMLIIRVIYTTLTELNKNIKTSVIPVSTLIISVLGLAIVDTIIIIAWNGLSPPHKSYEKKKVELVGLRDERVTLVETCNSEKESLLIAIFCFYKGGLLLLASVLSLLKRKNNEEHDDDLVQCRIALVSSLFTAFVAVPVVLSLPVNPNESFVIGGILLLLEITFLMCWIICSKILKAYRCIKGEALEFGIYSVERETISTPCVRPTYGCFCNGKQPGFSNNAFVESMIDLGPNPDEMVKSTDDNIEIGFGFDCKESEDVLPEDLPSHNEIDMQPYKEKDEEVDSDENDSCSDSESCTSNSESKTIENYDSTEATVIKSAVSIHASNFNGEETFNHSADGEEMFHRDEDLTNSVSEEESTNQNVETGETLTNRKSWWKQLIREGVLKGSKESPEQDGERSGRNTSVPSDMDKSRRFSKPSGNVKSENSSDSYGESSDED